MKELDYPFNAGDIISQRKKYRRILKTEETSRIPVNIAVLGGSTTNNIKLILELFLLNYGIEPKFYESEYNKYYEDGMFPNKELEEFSPDLIYICTSNRNISDYPVLTDTHEDIDNKKKSLFNKFRGLWDHLTETYHCPIIQNNFEYPFFRLMGNRDAYDERGRVNFITNINCLFYDYARTHGNFYICDINYLSASYGLDKWSDPYYWHMYKYAVAVPAIPYLSFNVANIIKSIYGKNKKAFNLDLDNTLWGGIVGDDGADNIEIGQETPVAQMYSEFQEYIKMHKQLGILLTINSKNDEENAAAGLKRPDSVLSPDDFVNIKANWEPKSVNLINASREMNLLTESYVFVDDNPAERAIISEQVKDAAVPEIGEAEHYIQILDKSGFFEVTEISDDDLKRNEMYIQNSKRLQEEVLFDNYDDYLKSLEMKCEIQGFIPAYISRIAQLTNKSNQFNLTTKRYSQSEIESIAGDSDYITLYGKLTDKFGDNGVVSVIIGKINDSKNELQIELWIMSCRVLKRKMENAMMNELLKNASAHKIKKIIGYYYPTSKNSMVKNFYEEMGFTKLSEDDKGNTAWELSVDSACYDTQHVIEVNSAGDNS